MLNKERATTGQTVCIKENWTGLIVRGRICEIYDNGIRIHGESYVNPDGTERQPYYGETGAKWEHVWLTAEDAYAGMECQSEAAVSAYCTEITDLASLLQFPLKHCLNGEEYTDWEAKKAYELKAKEFLGKEREKEGHSWF